MDEMGFYVSQNLHHNAITNIFYAPMAFFDTTVCCCIDVKHTKLTFLSSL